jgi:hypothetical protein
MYGHQRTTMVTDMSPVTWGRVPLVVEKSGGRGSGLACQAAGRGGLVDHLLLG